MDRYAGQVAPALAAGLVGLGDLGDPVLAALFALATFAAAARGDRISLPLHLMPISRTVLTLAAPVAGALGVACLVAYTGRGVPVGALAAAVVAAWLVAALGAWTRARFEEARPLRIAVIGDRVVARALAEELDSAGLSSYRIVGAVVPSPSEFSGGSVPVLGDVSRLDEIACSGSVDLLVNGASDSRLEIFERAAGACLERGVRMMELDQLYERLFGHVPIAAINSAWFRYLMHPDFGDASGRAKRAFDLVGAIVAALVCTPLLVLAALAIRLEDGGPVFYRQRRVGERGREFRIVKLRTMRVGAQASGERWSERADERVTRVGRLLRATHVDELPQLWNVLRGEMTLVGPRPEQPGIVTRLEQMLPYYERRHLARPGITGWAQTRCGYAGSESGTAWKLCHDLYYLKRRSLLADLLVSIETLGAVGYGAQYGQEAPDHSLILGQAPAG